MTKNRGKKLLSLFMATVLSASMLTVVGGPVSSVNADEGDKQVVCLGTSAINAPELGEADKPWTGSYVWYGAYDGEPVRYRVLDPSTATYGGRTMLLDCDNILYRTEFDADGKANDGASKPSEWAYSDIKRNLNGADFLYNPKIFTTVEKESIAESTVKPHDITIGGPVNQYVPEYTALSDDKIFLLDFEDVLNTNYGYSQDCGFDEEWKSHAVLNRKKTIDNENSGWWLRSPNFGNMSSVVYDVNDENNIVGYYVYRQYGVSPAFNINLENVIFSSVIPGTVRVKHADYKLTLLDNDMTVALQTAKKVEVKDNKVTVPYTISGINKDNATQVSVLILDKEYQELNTNNANVLYYGKLDVTGSFLTEGEGTFDFPSDINIYKWGTDYQVYILSEDVNGEKETDYSSEPVKLDKPYNIGSTGVCNWCFDAGSGTLTISGNGAMADYKMGKSPWYDLTLRIKNVVIEDGVTHIGNYAFAPAYIPSISIPDSVESIGNYAFLWCNALESVDLGNGVKTIGEGAFINTINGTGNKLTSMIIPPSVTSIADESIGYSSSNKIEGFTITGQCGSKAYKYAKANDFTWISNEHVWDEGVVTKKATCKEKGIKTYTCVCGETKTEEIDLKPHTLTKVPAKAATESEEGNKEYYKCSVCDKWFEDAAGTKEITDHSSVVISKLEPETTSPSATPTPEVEPTPDITRDTNDISPSNPVKVDEIEKTILNIKDDKDTKGSTFTLLKAKGTPKSKKSIKLSWSRVPGAEEYIIYGNKCGKKNKYQKIATVKGTSYTAKKLKKGTYYKYTIVAVKGDEAIATSKTIHVVTDGGKKGNNTKVKLSKTKLSLNAGKSKKIKATLKFKKKVAAHRKVAWESDNVSIATVKNGKITAVGKGTCYVYAYAQNGVSAKIKVTVK